MCAFLICYIALYVEANVRKAYKCSWNYLRLRLKLVNNFGYKFYVTMDFVIETDCVVFLGIWNLRGRDGLNKYVTKWEG